MVKTSLFVRIWLFIKSAYLNSGYYELCKRVSVFFGSRFQKSGVYHVFTKQRRDTSGSRLETKVNGFLKNFYTIFHKPFDKIGAEASCSTSGSLFMFMVKNWQYVSIRYYSVTFFIYMIVRLAASRAVGAMVGVYTISIGVLSCIGMIIDVSPAGLYMGCRLKKYIGLPEIEGNRKLKVDFKPYAAVTASIIVGSIFGLCSVVPMWYLVIGALIITPIILMRPKTGVYLIIVTFPFVHETLRVALCILVMFGMLASYIRKPREIIKFDMFDLSLLMFMIAILVGAVNANAGKWEVLTNLILVFSVFAIRRQANTRPFLYSIVNSVIAVALFMAGCGIYRNMTGQPVALLGTPEIFGEYLVITISITIAAIIGAKNKYSKNAFFVAFVFQLACLILTGEKCCLAAAMLVAAILLVTNGKRLFSVFVLGAGAALLIYPGVINSYMGMLRDAFLQRMDVWHGTVNMLKDFWPTGIGIGQTAFESIYPLYSAGDAVANQPESLGLTILCEMGAIGLIAFVFIVINFFRNASAVAKTDKNMKPLMTGLMAAMSAYLVHGIFGNAWYNDKIYMFFFIIIAFSAAADTCLKRENAENGGK